MGKYDLERLVLECMAEYALPQPRSSKTVKENTMKKSQLKALVNEVVRQCVREAGPQYAVNNGCSQMEQPGLRNKARLTQEDPEIHEGFISGDGEAGATSENEQSEVELLKQMGTILLKLLQMHRGEDAPVDDGQADDFDGGEFAPESPDAPESASDDEELKESNYKVQGRSLRVSTDAENNPKNVRQPRVGGK